MFAPALLLAFALGSQAAQSKVAGPAPSIHPPNLSELSVRQNQRLAPKLSASARAKIASAGGTLGAALKQQPQMSAAQLQKRAQEVTAVSFPGLVGSDVDGVAFLILMQAEQDQQTELQRTMVSIKSVDKQKQATRSVAAEQAGSISSEEQLRLQMAMDRRSKFTQALSNLEKSAVTTQDSIISNLK